MMWRGAVRPRVNARGLRTGPDDELQEHELAAAGRSAAELHGGEMRKMGIVGAIVLAVGLALGGGMLMASYAEAHGGGLNRCGCHFNRRAGTCHCHRDQGCGCECQPDRCER